MKKIIHHAASRGFADHGWLKSCHSFSFANYYDPDKIHFGLLRVLNDDEVAPGRGFGKHPHENMEIISIPLQGELVHEDTTGTKAVIRKNDVQIMSAGTGIVHSEMNNSSTDPVKFLQIWILPKNKDIKPRYDQKTFSPEERRNKIQTVISPDASGSAIRINQDAWLSLADLEKNHSVHYSLHNAAHGLFIFNLKGNIEVAGEKLGKRDAMGISDIQAKEINIKAIQNSEVLLIEIPMQQED